MSAPLHFLCFMQRLLTQHMWPSVTSGVKKERKKKKVPQVINATFSLKLMCCWGLCTSHMEILLQASLYSNIEHICDLSLTQTTHTHARNLLQTVRESKKMHMFIILYECDNQLYIVMVHFKNCFTKAGFILLFLWIGFSPVFCLFNSSIGSVDCIHIHTHARDALLFLFPSCSLVSTRCQGRASSCHAQFLSDWFSWVWKWILFFLFWKTGPRLGLCLRAKGTGNIWALHYHEALSVPYTSSPGSCSEECDCCEREQRQLIPVCRRSSSSGSGQVSFLGFGTGPLHVCTVCTLYTIQGQVEALYCFGFCVLGGNDVYIVL